jgi:hypothetical protein
LPCLPRALILCLLPLPALADCPGQTFVSCPVGGDRWLEVCIGAEDFTYAFGPRGAPELRLSVPMSAGTVTPWPGVGRAIWASVGFPNAGYTYEVWGSVDRVPDNPDPSARVNVLQGEDLLAQIPCLPGTVEAPAFVLEDAMAERGFCWNLTARRWQRGVCG